MLRIGTLIPVGPPLGFLPWHRSDRSPRSTREARSCSRHLCAGRRSDSKQAPPRTYPEIKTGPSFDDILNLSTPHQWFGSSPCSIPDPVLPGLFLNAHHHGSLPQQLKVVWCPLLQADPEGPALIFRAVANNTFLLSWTTISRLSGIDFTKIYVIK